MSRRYAALAFWEGDLRGLSERVLQFLLSLVQFQSSTRSFTTTKHKATNRKEELELTDEQQMNKYILRTFFRIEIFSQTTAPPSTWS